MSYQNRKLQKGKKIYEVMDTNLPTRKKKVVYEKRKQIKYVLCGYF